MSGTRRHTTGADFMRALVAAETLLDAGERRNHWLHIVRVGQLSAALAGLVTVCVLVAGEQQAWLAVVLASGFAVGVPAAAEVLLAQSLRGQIARDTAAMVDTISVLRELLPTIVEDEQWGATQQQFVQTRIQRFPIGRR